MTFVPDNVVKYFAFRNSVPLTEARSLFSQLDEFLAAAASSRQVPSLELDEAWHAFILHSKDYADYCLKRFGRFIHHVPNDVESLQTNSARCSNCSSNCSSR